MNVGVGIDIGGTDTKLVLLSADGTVVADGRVPTRQAEGPAELIRRVRETVTEFARAAEVSSDRVVALGAGVAGLIDQRRGVLVTAPNLPAWDETDLRAALEPFGVPVAFDNDAAVCALGEFALGAGRGADLLVCLTLGTGVGGGIVRRGTIIGGARGMAGEFGHMPFIPDGVACACGLHGCFEPYVNAGALVRVATELVMQGVLEVPGEWRDRIARGELRAEDVGRVASAGDSLALEVLRQVGRDLGRGIAMLVSALNPDCVVVAGGVAQAGDALMDAARDSARDSMMAALSDGLSIRSAGLGDQGGVLGAALLGLGTHGFSSLVNADLA